jgi:hypothetical protein
MVMSRSTLFALFAFPQILLSPLGCGELSPFQPEPLKVTATPYTNYSHVLEWNIATVITPELKPTPTPGPSPGPFPTPKVGDPCPVCYGTGKSGDRINPCDPCKGDGKVNEGDPILTSTSAPQVSLPTFGDLIKALEPAIKNLEAKLESLPPKEEVRVPEEKVDQSKLIPAPPEPQPLPLLNPKTFKEVTTYHMKWNMRYYTWSDDNRCFIDTLGHRVTFNSILNFHPSKHKFVLMGCQTGVCTQVPITRSTTRVEIPPNEFGTTKESTANGGRSN